MFYTQGCREVARLVGDASYLLAVVRGYFNAICGL